MNTNSRDTQPLFSILIANYNNGQYLQECLDSLFAQTYTHWEAILVDDASFDGISVELYEKYKTHPKIKIFYNETNKGCGYTKRRCAELAKGEICAFLDPDDAITKDAVEIMVKEQLANPDHCIIYSTHYVCDENLQVKKISSYPSVLSGKDYFTSKEGNISHFASFKTNKYKLTEGLSSKYKRAIDHDLFYKLEETGPSKFICKPLYYYRYHNSSISLNDNWWKAKYWDFQIIFDTYKRREQNNYFPNRSKKKILQDYDAYYLKLIRFFINKKEFQRALKFLLVSLRYSTPKSLIKKLNLILLIPFKAIT